MLPLIIGGPFIDNSYQLEKPSKSTNDINFASFGPQRRFSNFNACSIYNHLDNRSHCSIITLYYGHCQIPTSPVFNVRFNL